PQLLDDQQPEEARNFNATDCLNFGYKYEIVPEGLLPRFIVRTHHLSEMEGRWKSGVILLDPESRARALVQADSSTGMVGIHVDGPEETRRELLSVIRYNFRIIHSDYEFKPVELVYPSGLPEKSFVLDELQALSRSGASTIPVLHRDSRVVMQDIQS